jgi:hypothetical protein
MKNLNTLIRTLVGVVLLGSSLASQAGGDLDPCGPATKKFLTAGAPQDPKNSLSQAQLDRIKTIVSGDRSLSTYAHQLERREDKNLPFVMGLLFESVTLRPNEAIESKVARVIGSLGLHSVPDSLLAGLTPAQLRRWQRGLVSAFEALRFHDEVNSEHFVRVFNVYTTLARLARIPESDLSVGIRTLSAAASGVLARGRLSGVQSARIYQFAKAATRQAMGLQSPLLTDLALATHGTDFEVVLMSSQTITSFPAGAVPSSYIGVHFVRWPRTTIPESRPNSVILDKQYKWVTGDQKFSATLKVRVGRETKSVAPRIKTLNYRGMWADRKLTGLVLVSDNVGDFRAELIGEYKEYYADNGFRFETLMRSDFKAWLGKVISDGELDYMIKESHSVGGRNFLGTKSAVKIYKGTRRVSSNGRQEVVYIVRSVDSSGEIDLTVADFGEWMKQRAESKNSPQLLYVNSTCYSIEDQCELVNAVQNPLLVAVGSDDQLTTFTNEPAGSLYQLIDGVRKGETFGSIRRKTEKAVNDANKLAEKLNDYEMEVDLDDESLLFPDDPSWADAIAGGVPRPLIVDVEVKDSNGQIVDLEILREAGHAQP